MMKDRSNAGCHFHFDNVFIEGKETYGGIDLYQIGEICCESGYEIKPHLQYCLELSYIVSGSGYFYIDDTCIKVSEGDVIFNAEGHMHTIKTDSSSMLRFVYMGFKFNEAAGVELAEIHNFLQSSPYQHSKDTHGIMMPFIRNIDEFYSQNPYSKIVIKNYIEEIIVLSYRAFSEKGNKISRYVPRKSAHSVGYMVYSVIRYVENHIYELKSIRTIAEDLGYSYSYVSHTFKDKTGMTLQRYINHKKVEKALELFKFGNLSVKQVSERLNYETLQSFSKAFSRIMGVPPSRYAAMQRDDATI